MPVNMGFFRRLPIGMLWFSDGLAITEAAKEYSNAVGAKVLRIGTMTPEEALEAVASYLSHENQIGLRMAAPEFLVRLAVVQHLKLLDSAGRVPFTLQKPGGEPFTLSIPIDDPRVPRLDLAAIAQAPTPLYLTQKGSYYWYRYLPDSQTFYIQYNRCANDPKQRFADFVRAAMEDADAKAAAHPDGSVYIFIREIDIVTLPNSKLRISFSTKFFRLTKEGDPPELDPDILMQPTLADALSGRDPVLEAAIRGR